MRGFEEKKRVCFTVFLAAGETGAAAKEWRFSSACALKENIQSKLRRTMNGKIREEGINEQMGKSALTAAVKMLLSKPSPPT